MRLQLTILFGIIVLPIPKKTGKPVGGGGGGHPPPGHQRVKKSNRKFLWLYVFTDVIVSVDITLLSQVRHACFHTSGIAS